MIIFLNNKFKASLEQIKYCLNNNSNKGRETQPPNNREITSLLPIGLIQVISSGSYNPSPTMITTFPTRHPTSLANHLPSGTFIYLLSWKRLNKQTEKTTKWHCYSLASSHFLVSFCFCCFNLGLIASAFSPSFSKLTPHSVLWIPLSTLLPLISCFPSMLRQFCSHPCQSCLCHRPAGVVGSWRMGPVFRARVNPCP